MLPRGGDRVGPGPGRLDFQAAPPPAVHQPSGGAQDPVAQCLGSAVTKLPSRASSLSQAALTLKSKDGKCPGRPAWP